MLKKNRTEQIFKGFSLSPGFTEGLVCHFQIGSLEQTAVYQISLKQIDNEIQKLHNAIHLTMIDLQQISKNIEKTLGINEAKIFDTYLLLMQDKTLNQAIINKIQNDKYNVEFAVKSTYEEYENLFQNMQDKYLRERSMDFTDIKNRLLRHLTGENATFRCGVQCNSKKSTDFNRIILTKELTATMITLVNEYHIRGFITTQGGTNSHASILCRAAGIPHITGIRNIQQIKCGTHVIIDSDSGKVIINPASSTLQSFKKQHPGKIQRNQGGISVNRKTGPVIKSASGKKITVYANIINISEIKLIHKYHLAGIGLLRTEYLFMDYPDFPDCNKQTEIYSAILKETQGKPVTFRLFDIGGDKKVKGLHFENEDNPLLGLRGIRYLMKHRHLIQDQITAICRASVHGKARILIPMISNLDELKKVLKLIRSIFNEQKNIPPLPVGMMFEVPSVFLNPEPYLQRVDFASIGSNDLTQYLFGVDRNNFNVSEYYKSTDSVIFRLFSQMVKATEKLGKELSLCGEINYETPFIENIISSGIQNISLTPFGFTKLYDRLSNRST